MSLAVALVWAAILPLLFAMVSHDDSSAEADASSTSASDSSGGLSAAGAAADQDMPNAEAGSAETPCGEEEQPGPGQFQFRIIDEDGAPLGLRQPLEYRVYDEGGGVVQEGMLDSGGTITVDADPSGRYALWLDGEYVTFHDETHDENGEQ